MINIYTFKDETTVRATIERMYGTHGPKMLNGKGWIVLTKVQILAVSSTSTMTEVGKNMSDSTNLGKYG